MSEPLYHLLIPGKFEVWCRPGKAVDNLCITNKPSKTTCANCLSAFRTMPSGKKKSFRVAHTNRPSRE